MHFQRRQACFSPAPVVSFALSGSILTSASGGRTIFLTNISSTTPTHPTAACYWHPATGACPVCGLGRPADPLQPTEGQGRPVGSGHRPRRHRYPIAGGEEIAHWYEGTLNVARIRRLPGLRAVVGVVNLNSGLRKGISKTASLQAATAHPLR